MHSYPEVENINLAEEPGQNEADHADTTSSEQVSSSEESEKKQVELKSADAFDSSEAEEETIPPKSAKSKKEDKPAHEKTTIMVEDKNLNVQKKKSK